MISTYAVLRRQKEHELKNIDTIAFGENTFLPDRTDMLEGAVKLSYYDKIILSENDTDNIFCLWNYILEQFTNYLLHGKCTISYPDRPQELNIKNIGTELVHIKSNTDNIIIYKTEIINDIITGSKRFIDFLSEMRYTTDSSYLNAKYMNILSLLKNPR